VVTLLILVATSDYWSVMWRSFPHMGLGAETELYEKGRLTILFWKDLIDYFCMPYYFIALWYFLRERVF